MSKSDLVRNVLNPIPNTLYKITHSQNLDLFGIQMQWSAKVFYSFPSGLLFKKRLHELNKTGTNYFDLDVCVNVRKVFGSNQAK